MQKIKLIVSAKTDKVKKMGKKENISVEWPLSALNSIFYFVVLFVFGNTYLILSFEKPRFKSTILLLFWTFATATSQYICCEKSLFVTFLEMNGLCPQSTSGIIYTVKRLLLFEVIVAEACGLWVQLHNIYSENLNLCAGPGDLQYMSFYSIFVVNVARAAVQLGCLSGGMSVLIDMQ